MAKVYSFNRIYTSFIHHHEGMPLSDHDPKESPEILSDTDLEAEINAASPHRLIQILFDGALARVTAAKIALDQNRDSVALVNEAIGIIGGLRSSLDMEAAGDLPESLDSLYEYMETCLHEAAQNSSAAKLDEVKGLLETLKSGWDGIAP